jgi:CRISPR-associated Csx2 family protein
MSQKKILISFLGTGLSNKNALSAEKLIYNNIKYRFEDNQTIETPYISFALAKYHAVECILLIGTSKSRWDELYKYHAERLMVFDETIYKQLNALVAKDIWDAETDKDLHALLCNLNLLLGGTSRCLIIPSGETRKEQIEIFHKIASALEELVTENSNIVLDITHSFRSLPLFTMSVFNYLTEVRHNTIRLDKIVYGRLEDGMIIDVTAAAEFNTWTKAAHAFGEYGKGELLANLLPENEGKAVQSFSDALSLNYVNDITKQIGKLEELLETFDNEIGFLIVPKVIESFINRLKSTENEASAFQYQLAKWHFENKNYNSSYLLLTEGVITKICELEGSNWKNKDDRQSAKNLLFSHLSYAKYNRFYNQINQIRNELVHANEQSLGTSSGLIRKLKKLLIEFGQF